MAKPPVAVEQGLFQLTAVVPTFNERGRLAARSALWARNSRP
ncbi:hypothetical protein SAMN02745157_2444 [Kaistia soli DSM 19436]|uniref:Uncharacterized protein n=1 Tax=Kaistia soli DSM 19436 TaxID=1122133 RepID=A0A1M5CRX9_9HYPH|nr:hypothetical protein [Kaistia soli]SHF57518.1 hypothetical protein SAMN02745157_2444 [Kaistia soli DSM 19436]